MEVEEDADDCSDFTTHRNRRQEDVVLVLRVPRGVQSHDASVGGAEVEDAHVEVLDHLGLRAAGLLVSVPVSRKFVT